LNGNVIMSGEFRKTLFDNFNNIGFPEFQTEHVIMASL
jgi:hypothetical protein